MLEQQDTLHAGYVNLGSHVKFQMIKSDRSCRQVRTCELPPLHHFFQALAIIIAGLPHFSSKVDNYFIIVFHTLFSFTFHLKLIYTG